MYYSILSEKFDGRILLDFSINKPLDSHGDLFYNLLLKDVTDEKLYNSIVNVRDNKTSLKNLSHLIYLFPWSIQHKFLPPTINSNIYESNLENGLAVPNKEKNLLKKELANYIKGFKRLGMISSDLLNLRLIGFTSRNNLVYSRVRELCMNDVEVKLVCKIGLKIVEYLGKVVFFDRNLNILLLNGIFTYIKFVLIITLIFNYFTGTTSSWQLFTEELYFKLLGHQLLEKWLNFIFEQFIYSSFISSCFYMLYYALSQHLQFSRVQIPPLATSF
ncbi:uncharacterized protein TA10750 [Theileria annulata]|uniref:Uncharacterized protein n=1 Tax=Theileria annulata TaxID=5874 RepID=Q4U8F4_THEAN|nr:uncharacterized protein TA10750 [Theileria annulata]CAI76899.1 hypothetical protein TA10750 [Theileria annulata]|eukprot:XP_953524.1 hypothetical protein TA10750 [Theileria annulata]